MIRKLLRFVGWVMRWPYVWIEDDEHRVYRRRVRVTPFGPTVRHPETGYTCKLSEDGTCSRSRYSSFGGKWLPANRPARHLFESKS